jgi:hypothetical protein
MLLFAAAIDAGFAMPLAPRRHHYHYCHIISADYFHLLLLIPLMIEYFFRHCRH